MPSASYQRGTTAYAITAAKQAFLSLVRRGSSVPPLPVDRFLAPDLAAAERLVDLTPEDGANLYDAAAAAAVYLCHGRRLDSEAGIRAGYFSYNHSEAYVEAVLAQHPAVRRVIEAELDLHSTFDAVDTAAILLVLPAGALQAPIWVYYRNMQFLRQRLLLSWDAPLVNDFFAMVFHGLLRRWSANDSGGDC